MEYRVLGSTGVKVSVQCLGAMMFGAWGNPDHDESIRMIHRALDAGINFIDTADVYSAGESEEIVGKALKGKRDEVFLATKVHGQMGPGRNDQGNSRYWIMKEVENSLRRLGTDHIDLYQIHRPEPDTEIDETLGALTDLVRQGKVRYIGSSTFPGWQIVEAQWAAEAHGLERFVCEQPPYSIFVRHIEDDVLPVTQRYGMGAIVWSPLAGGWLTGKYRKEQEVPEDSRAARAMKAWGGNSPVAKRFDMSRPANQKKLELVEELALVAEKAGISMTHMANSFVLAHPGVTSAIIGPRTPEQLDDALAGADVVLDDATLDAIDEIVAPGTTLEVNDRGYRGPWLTAGARRR
jgi:aryl-alcohol dehydrogenase-like predicted oxidoreductase